VTNFQRMNATSQIFELAFVDLRDRGGGGYQVRDRHNLMKEGERDNEGK